MGFLRRHEGPQGTRCQMREQLLAVGDDFWIETDDRQRAFNVEVAPGENHALILAATVCIDESAGALATGTGKLNRMDSR